MPKPKDTSEMCDRVRPYLRDLTNWLNRRQLEVDKLLDKAGLPHQHTIKDDPPPPPPDLGP